MIGLRLAACAFLLGFHLPGAAADEIYSTATLWEDGRTVGAVAIGADGSRVAFAFDESNARVRTTDEAATTIADLSWDGGDAYFAVFSADGARLALGTADGAVRVWDVATARAIATIQLPLPGAAYASFSPDGTRLVTAGADGIARIWEADGGRALGELAGHTADLRDAAFSADGATIATASRDKTVRLWNAADGSARMLLQHSDAVNSVSFSADGRRLVSGGHDGAAHVFDLASGQEIATLRAADSDAEVLDARFSPDGARIVTGADDQIVRVWNAAGGTPLAELQRHLGAIRTVQFSADGARIFSTAHDATGRIWTRAPETRLPDGLAGLWHPDMGDDPQASPPELIGEVCRSMPLAIREDGLIVSFEGWKPDPPQATMHLRCAADLSCQLFGGPPAQGQEAQASARLTLDGDIATLCMLGECRPFKRCPALAWTEEERSSGYADAWEARVLRLEP